MSMLNVSESARGFSFEGEGLLTISLSSVEFTTKDVDKTMATMVEEPYVNHIPTITGGIGYKDLHRFYRDFFIPGTYLGADSYCLANMGT